MTGERDLSELLQHMTPQQQPGTFVYCTFPSGESPAAPSPIAAFCEAEGLTAIVRADVRRGAIENRLSGEVQVQQPQRLTRPILWTFALVLCRALILRRGPALCPLPPPNGLR